MSRTKQHPRFSLLSLVIVVAGVALALTILKLSRENQALRTELAGYHAELGVLDDRFPDRFTAIRVQTEDTLIRRTWKWRLRPPPGSNAYLSMAAGPIPLTGHLPPQFSIPLLPEQEHVVDVVAALDSPTGLWRVALSWRRDDGRVHTQVWEVDIDWGKGARPGGADIDVLEGVSFRTQFLPTAQRTVVARVRDPATTSTQAPGFMLWVGPK